MSPVTHTRRRTTKGITTAILSILLFSMLAGAAFAGQSTTTTSARWQGGPSATPTLPIGTYQPPVEFPVTEVPSYVAMAEPPADHDVVTVLLLGSDTENPTNSGRTDSLMVVAINRTAGTASFLSIPRDLFVYIPGWTMQRINTAFGHGNLTGYEGGGYALLKDTIRYNLGIDIDFYAWVNFVGFQQIVDSLGGVEISVDCTLQDWHLISPELDPTIEDNWELFTLPVGVHQIDGDLALWYARSRRTSSDFDRGRRQQDLMRAVWRRLQELGLLNQLPDLWGQVVEMVDTDMDLADVLGLIPLALSIDSNHLAFYTFRAQQHVESWRTPAGSSVQLPVPEAVTALVHNFMQPPTSHHLDQNGMLIEVINASGHEGLDRVAADRLAREGFIAIAAGNNAQYRPDSVIYDYTGRARGGAVPALLELLRISSESVIQEPDPNRAVDYRVVIGGSYRSCTYGVLPPVATPTPESAGAGGDS